MKAFWALLKVSFVSMLLSAFSLGRNKAKAASSITALIGLSAIVLLLSGTYSFALAAVLAPMGMLDFMLLSMTLLGMFIAVMLTIYSAQGFVYSTKDIDLVLSLPVSSFSVMLARVAALYLEVLLIVELSMLPAGVAYLVYGGSNGIPVLLLMAVTGVFIAFVPTLLGLVFGAVVGLLVSRLKYKSLFTILFSILLFIGIFYFSFTTPATIEQGDIDFSMLRTTVTEAFAPLGWFINGVGGLQIVPLLILWAVCTVPFFLVTWLFSLFYKSMLTHLASHRLKNDYKLREIRSGSSFTALLKKEAGRFFGTPVYLMNTGIGAIMAFVLAVLAIFNRGAINDVMSGMIDVPGGEIVFAARAPLLLGLMGFLVMTLFPACVSISLESKSLWILKTAPVSTTAIFAAKAMLNFLLCLVTVAITVPLLGVSLSVAAADIACIMVVCLLFAAFISVFGLLINLWFPRLDYTNETAVIKQSASSGFGLLGNFVVALLVGGLYFLMGGLQANFIVFCMVASGLLLLLALAAIMLLKKVGVKLFAEL